jgi:hypothetical protein
MKTFIALILAASAAFFTPAHAQSVSIRQKGESVTLMKEACSEKVKKHIKDAYHPMFYKAAAVLKGKRYEACWTIAGSDVLVIFDDGEYSTFPSEMFKKDESL